MTDTIPTVPRLHWNHVFATVNELKSKSILLRELAVTLNSTDEEMRRVADMLVRQGRCSIVMSVGEKTGLMLCVKEPRLTRRDILVKKDYGDRPLPENTFDSKPHKDSDQVFTAR